MKIDTSELLKMAEEAGIPVDHENMYWCGVENIERLAALVRQQALEDAAAKIETIEDDYEAIGFMDEAAICGYCAAAVRERER